ncbi:MAG: porin family protein [Candidatus Omnitrophica bacterium]|nr:porin family protein [Candidatus Omnitrophota bacterium]
MKRVVILGFCCSLMAAGPAMAQQPDVHSFDLGPEVYYFNYEEPGVMEEDGVFYGVTADYHYHNTLMLGLEGRFAYGSVDYTSPGSGSIDDIDDFVIETRGTAGWDWTLNDRVLLTPFGGFGYRYLNDDTSGRTSTTGAAGYERESNYYYSPFGLAMRWTGQRGWSVSVSGEYDLFWSGKQISHLSDAVSTLNDLENTQEGGYGTRTSLAVEKTGQRIDWVFEAFWRYWDIEESNAAPLTLSGTVIGVGFEPANDTYELGGRITARF